MPSKLTKRFVDALRPKDKPYEERDTEVVGFLCRVQPTGTKTFWLAYPFPGKRAPRYRLGAYPNVSVEGARALAKAAAGDVARGINPAERRKAEIAKAAKEKGSTLRAYLDGPYEKWAKAHLKSAEAQLLRIRSDFAKQLDKPLELIDKKFVGQLQQEWLSAGLKPRTVNRDLQRISGVLTHAVEEGDRLERHPLKGAVKPLRFDKRKLPKYLKPDEEAALRAALIRREDRIRDQRRRHNEWLKERHRDPMPEHSGVFVDYLRPMTLVSLNGGLRRGELFNLPWPSVNFLTGLLEVEGDENDDGGTGSKSGHSRVIPMNVELKSTLIAWHEQYGRPTEGLVFPSPDGGGRFNNITKAWNGVRKDAGMPKAQFRWLRDTFASKLVQRGTPLLVVKELLGHADITTTEIYAKLAPNNLTAAVALLDTVAA